MDMRRVGAVALLALGLAASAGGPADAQYASRPYRVATSGQRMVLAYFMSLFPDCRSMGDASISVLQPPAHGDLGTGRGSDYPLYGGLNTHSVCNTRKVPSTRLYYTAAPGYEGTDVVKVSVAYPDNSGRIYAYVISVR